MAKTAPHYTAAQISAALGQSKRGVLKALETISPSAQVNIGGKLAFAWALSALPARWQVELQAKAQSAGCRDAEHLLIAPVEPWRPPLPFAQISQEHIDKAVNLQSALLPSLARQNDPAVSDAELARRGVKDFEAVFGYAISERHWLRLFERTVHRDRGLDQWHRVEIFLDDRIGAKPALAPAVARKQYLHRGLEEMLAQLENRADPTAEDRRFLFDAAFHHFEKLLAEAADRREERLIKASLLDFLLSAVPALSKTPKAFRRAFELNLKRWQENGRNPDGLADLRRINSGNFRRPEFEADRKEIVARAVLHGGNESLAVRLLRREGKLSPEFLDYYSFDPRRNKSYVPKSIRAEVSPAVDMCGPLHRGDWEAKMRGPYIPRDWSGVDAGNWFSGDDVTWNNYFYFYEAGQLHIERGECLLQAELRSGYPLGFVLIAGKYNGRHIRSGILRVHDRIGLPHEGFYYERGVWKSRWVSGIKGRNAMHWRETESGFSGLGLNLNVRHATTPRAKPIEGLIRILQERQRCEPGFVGFNERTHKMERMQEFIARARKGKEHPGNELLEMGEWVKRIGAILEEFARDPQNGKMLNGLSPAEMFAEAANRRPFRKLADDTRYLLSTHKQPVTVRQEGIVLTIGGERMLYANEETGKRIGQQALAFYNVDHPEILTVSDMKRQNYFTVKRILLPAMSATKEQFAQAHSQIKGHRQAAKVIYGEIQHAPVGSITRDNDHVEDVKELGRFHNEQVAQFKHEQSAATRKLRKIQTAAAVTGASVKSQIRNPDRVLAGIEREKEIRERIAQKEAMARDGNQPGKETS